MDWLGDLWHYPFRVEVWGTANGWAGALLTGFSFLLAANVYRKNRQDKLREQASLIALSGHYTSAMDEDFFLVSVRGRVHNYSSSLVTHAAIEVEMTNRTARHRLSWVDRWFRPSKTRIAHHPLREDMDITDTILPGEDRRYFVEIPYEASVCAEEVVVKLTFMDANSVEWERPYMGAPSEPKLPGKLRARIIRQLYWRGWEKEHPESDDENPEIEESQAEKEKRPRND